MLASFDALISPVFLADLESVPIEQVRERRAICDDAEVALSYVRRIVQGRLDILMGGAADVDHLPELLADPVRTGGPGRLSSRLAPGELPPELEAALEAAVAADDLVALERRVSTLRRSVHVTIDALQNELVRRYKSGEADVDSLLT